MEPEPSSEREIGFSEEGGEGKAFQAQAAACVKPAGERKQNSQPAGSGLRLAAAQAQMRLWDTTRSTRRALKGWIGGVRGSDLKSVGHDCS